MIGRGSIPLCVEGGVSPAGACGKANVGISNDKGGEKPLAARLQVLDQRQSDQGQSGPKWLSRTARGRWQNRLIFRYPLGDVETQSTMRQLTEQLVKGVEVDWQANPPQDSNLTWSVLPDNPIVHVIILPRKSAKHNSSGYPYRKRTHVVGLNILRRLSDSRLGTRQINPVTSGKGSLPVSRRAQRIGQATV